MQRTITIEASPHQVYTHIASLQNWSEWSAWHHTVGKNNISYSGPETGVGATCQWNTSDQKLGMGKITITTAHINEAIETEILLNNELSAHGCYTLTTMESGTLLTYEFESDLGDNFFNRFVGLYLETMIAQYFESGLKKLKLTTESDQYTLESLADLEYSSTDQEL